jgi:hypothetical protein
LSTLVFNVAGAVAAASSLTLPNREFMQLWLPPPSLRWRDSPCASIDSVIVAVVVSVVDAVDAAFLLLSAFVPGGVSAFAAAAAAAAAAPGATALCALLLPHPMVSTCVSLLLDCACFDDVCE